MTGWPPDADAVARQLFFVLDDENRPVPAGSFEHYAEFFRSLRGRVAHTRISPDVYVSTIFLGINTGLGMPPRIFETMIFGGALHLEQWRYVSWDDAVTGHAAAVRRAREALNVEVDNER